MAYREKLDIISLGMHDYNRDDTHIWPGIPHSYLYAPPGTPYDPENPPVIHGDGFPYIQRGHLTLARREIPMTDGEYQSLVARLRMLRATGAIQVRYDMGDGRIETIHFDDVWLKLNPFDGTPARILLAIELTP